jgi:hypothetical protein
MPLNQQRERASITGAGPPDQLTVADVHTSKCQPGVPRLPGSGRQARPPAMAPPAQGPDGVGRAKGQAQNAGRTSLPCQWGRSRQNWALSSLISCTRFWIWA